MLLEGGLLRRRRVKLIFQTELAECGIACLAMVANFHGLKIDLVQMRRRFLPSLRGVTLKYLMKTADEVDLAPRAVKLDITDLDKLHLPAILHWGFNHFVVIARVKKRKALIFDPNGQTGWQTSEQLSKFFTGVALELRPTSNFKRSDERVSFKLNQLWHRADGFVSSIAQVIVLSVILEIFVVLLPYYMQFSVDWVLPALDKDLLTTLALGFGLFTFVYAVATWIRGFVILLVGSKLGYGLASNIGRRLFRLPIDWFERRHLGDVLSRFQSIGPIQTLLTEGAIAGLIDGLMSLVTLGIMSIYSVELTMLALACLLSCAVVKLVCLPMQQRAQEASLVARGIEQTHMIESLRGITTIRLSNRETSRHAIWQSYLTDSVNATINLGRINQWQLSATTLFLGFEGIISIYLSISKVISGGFSVGMVFAFIAYKTQFLEKAISCINQLIAFRMLSLHMDRLSDIALTREDASFVSDLSTSRRLGGSLELRGVSYRYSPTDPIVIDNVSFRIKAGEHIAITGPSGGGKSTLLKLMLGLVSPNTGEILIDDMPIAQFGYKNFYDQIGAVLQEDSLFMGTLAENISLFDSRPDETRIEACARAAAIHKDIEAMPMGYQTLVANMGSTLSGGQKQRVLLARAIYREPKILVLDEGTAHLDLEHEAIVNRSIDQMGITRVIIAHRPETIAMAGRVLRVEHGKLTETFKVASPSGAVLPV